ncbi:DUF262 domain-containing protein [Azospirillum argentinense]
MNSSIISQPAARVFAVTDLVDAVREGRIRIPEFQRPLRWQWQDVERLFDSIVKGYPVGNLLFWQKEAPEADINLGGLRFHAPRFQDGLWVVDGQQRLISLANALSDERDGDDRFSLAYDFKKPGFVRPRSGDDETIPLSTLFDLQKLILWFTQHPEASSKLEEATRITKVIREYQIPAYLVIKNDEETLRDIFDRLNNYGKRLTSAEVFSALHSQGGNGEEYAPSFQRIAEVVHAKTGFGIIDDDTLMRAILARRGGDVTRDIRIEFSEGVRGSRDFGNESTTDAYREGGQALTRAIEFLQKDAGIPHFAFLPYRYLLVALTRFFAHFPSPRPRNRDLLKRWFWRAAMIGPGPFSSSWTIAGRTLTARIKVGDESGSVQELLKSPIDAELRSPKLTGFRTNAVQGRIVLAALWALGPRSPRTGKPYDRQQLADAIPPDGTLAGVALRIFGREPEQQKAWAANRILVLEDELPSTLVDLLLDRYHDHSEESADFFASHALDGGSMNALVQDDRCSFLERRQVQLEGIVKAFLEAMSGSGLEDTPPLEVFDLDDTEGDNSDEQR